MILVMSGSIEVESNGGGSPIAADAGDFAGLYEALGGAPGTFRAKVVVPGQALRFFRSELMDLLADDIDLLQGIFSSLLRVTEAPMKA